MAIEEQNPLLSTQKPTDSGLHVALHPLVLLTISDYITRHTLRNQTTPIIGALLGQQNGREITIEHAFEVLVNAAVKPESPTDVTLNETWFAERLQQMKEVHKQPALDLVGWYTLMPESGPQPHHLPIHRQILEHTDPTLLLGFHPIAALEKTTGGKLPLTIYESNYEAEGAVADGEDKPMSDGEDSQIKLKFRELPYTVETGEAEMISVDFVAKGSGNAAAITTGTTSKGKTAEASDKQDKGPHLSREDEELIASLNAKANAIKMLQSRITLLATYLQSLPPSFVTGKPLDASEVESKQYAPIDYAILRSIQALLNRLTLLIPADKGTYKQQQLAEQNDVNLVSLLSSMVQNIKDVRETGRKYAVVEHSRQQAKSKHGVSSNGGAFNFDSSLGGVSFGQGGNEGYYEAP